MTHKIYLPLLAVLLSSCASQQFYDKVQVGTIKNSPHVKWVGPNKFELVVRADAPFEFQRYNGEVIRPLAINTDGGSVPRQFWDMRGMSPWTYAPGYLVHDWLYEAHRQGNRHAGYSKEGEKRFYDQEQADWILAEVIKTQMESDKKAEDDPKPRRLKLIYLAVKAFGKKAFNGQSNPVAQPEVLAQASNAAGSAVGMLVPAVITDALDMVKSEAGMAPSEPKQIEGYSRAPTPTAQKPASAAGVKTIRKS